MDTFELIATERRSLANVLQTLTPEQWEQPSLCENWKVRDVFAHLVFPLETSFPAVLVKLVKARFDFNRMSGDAARADRRPPAEMISAYLAQAENRFTPPGFPAAAPLTDIVVHGEDMLRPLGVAHQVEEDSRRAVMDFLITPKAARAFVGKGLLDGLHLEATDIGWSSGDGPSVRGPALDLALAICGRRAGFEALAGDGLDTFRARL